MSVSTKSNKQIAETSILKELDELITYISEDGDADLQEDLIDPSFFIGNFEEAMEIEVPTLTSVANDLPKENPENQNQRQPGLFSDRMEQIKKAKEIKSDPVAEQPAVTDDNIERLVNALVAEHLPKIEAELRAKIRAELEAKK